MTAPLQLDKENVTAGIYQLDIGLKRRNKD